MTHYTVTRHTHGIAITGPVPLSDFSALLTKWGEEGYEQMRTDIGDVLGAAVAVVRNEEDAVAWRKELDIRADHPDWLRSGDTGISSKTIYATFTNTWHCLGRPAAPRDADDFGRCHRLLLRYPEWRAKLSEVAAKCPEFAPLVPIWDELDRLFVDGKSIELSKRIWEATK